MSVLMEGCKAEHSQNTEDWREVEREAERELSREQIRFCGARAGKPFPTPVVSDHWLTDRAGKGAEAQCVFQQRTSLCPEEDAS